MIDAQMLLDAANHRLAGWSPDDIDKCIAQIDQDGPEADLGEHLPQDARDAASAVSALHVLYAHALGDEVALFRHGYGVLPSFQQAMRASVQRGGDQLTRMIHEHLAAAPETTARAMWDDFGNQADLGISDVLADFDGERLTYYPTEHGQMKDISYLAFERRVLRIRALLQ